MILLLLVALATAETVAVTLPLTAPVVDFDTLVWGEMMSGVYRSMVDDDCDSNTEACTMFLKFAAGAGGLYHTHTHDYASVVVKGDTYQHWSCGEKPKTYAVGQAKKPVIAGACHTDLNPGTEDVIIYVEQTGPQDFIPCDCERQVTMTSLIEDSFTCMFSVLGKYTEGSDEHNALAQQFGSLYAVKNMGLWVTASDLAEAHQFCTDDSLGLGTDYCMSTMAMISTAGVSYCDAHCVGAVDAIQAIHDDHNVCEDWGKDHYFALALPKADFDCATLNPVHDNSETYAARADVVGACEAAMEQAKKGDEMGGNSGRDAICKTFDKEKMCQGAEFNKCMQDCEACGKDGTCGEECNACMAYGCCIEMPGNETPPCDQSQTQIWQNAWLDKVNEGGDAADACNAILKGDMGRACTCMNAFEMPPPNCVLDGSNPYDGWQMCKASPDNGQEDQCGNFDKDGVCKGSEFENCAMDCAACTLTDSCPTTCDACSKFACCIEEPEEKECDAETNQKWETMFGMKMAMQGAVGDACKQVAERSGEMTATCTCMGSFTEEEMRPFKDCTIDGNYVNAFKMLCHDDGRGGKDEYCKTFDKKTCQGAEFDMCMRTCEACGMKGTCGEECDACSKFACCIEMPGNETTMCSEAQTQIWQKAWVDKVNEGGDAADACNAILKGDLKNVCTCMNAFEMPPPNCVLDGSNPYDGWQMCKAPPADKSCMKYAKTSECGMEAEDMCGCFESMMENGALPDCEMDDGKLATMYAEKCAICDSDDAKKCVKDCSVCVKCATPRKVLGLDECTAEQQTKVAALVMQKLQLGGEVQAACTELMAQNMENVCTCLDSFTEDEISEFDCVFMGQNPYAGWMGCQADKKCSECDKCEPCMEFSKCAIKDIFKNQCNTDAAKKCVTDCAKCVPCALGLQTEGCEDCATCATCKELMHCIPTRQNCAGTFSKCTSKCEKAGGRIFTETMKQKGVGVSCPTAKNCKKGDDLCKVLKKVAMKKMKFKQKVKGITKEQCAGVKGAIRKGTAKQLKIAEEGVTVKEEGAGVCVDGNRRRLATGSQSFAVEAEVESSNVEEAKKTVASDNFQNAIVSEASQGGMKDLKTEKVEANKIEENEVEDGKDGVFAFGTFVFGVFALLL